jgi:tyrosyl-tRNA synthetase
VEANLAGIRKQLEKFLDFETKINPARIVNNADWLVQESLMTFLRDIGKHFTINWMMQKESVKRRIESEDGISYTEFTYMLLQAYDFLKLHDLYGCNFQMGGSDQWGNITAGAELIRKLRGGRAHGLVYPLITNSSGTKFGKTESGTIWIDAKRTSPYRFYQFWYNTADADVIRYLKYFTWLTQAEIAELESICISAPEKRAAQKTLAREVTIMVHGQTELDKAERASLMLFGAGMEGFKTSEILDVFSDVPSKEIGSSIGLPIADLLLSSGLVSSGSDAKRLIQSGGIYMNNHRISDPKYFVTGSDLIDDSIIVLNRGKKNYFVFKAIKK